MGGCDGVGYVMCVSYRTSEGLEGAINASCQSKQNEKKRKQPT